MLSILIVLLTTTVFAETFQGASMKITTLNATRYVSTIDLEKNAGIAIKSLPGQKEAAACLKERCALVEGTIERDGSHLVPVQALVDALSLQARFSPDGDSVAFDLAPVSSREEEGFALLDVGQLAPNFRLPTLNGEFISLAELRGKRVLINSWASW